MSGAPDALVDFHTDGDDVFRAPHASKHSTVSCASTALYMDASEQALVRTVYARALFLDTGATLEDLREAVTTLGDVVRIARRVFGGEHPLTMALGEDLQDARAALRARETPPGSA